MKKIPTGAVALLVVTGFLGFPVLNWAQAKPIKGEVVYLKIPYACFNDLKVSFWGNTAWKATVGIAENEATVDKMANWRLSGFPPMAEYKVKKVKFDNSTGATVVDLASYIFPNIKLTFEKGKVQQLFPMVVATSMEVDAYRKGTFNLLAAKFFDGTPLSSLTEEQKQALCTYASVVAHGTTMGSTIYKENLYLKVDMGSDTSVYNELKLSQIQRVAKVLNENLLAVLKGFTIPVKDDMGIYGLNLEFQIPHKSFLNEASEPTLDKLEIYAPIDLILQFSDADITSQQFIDGCVIIVDGNRISVPLASY